MCVYHVSCAFVCECVCVCVCVWVRMRVYLRVARFRKTANSKEHMVEISTFFGTIKDPPTMTELNENGTGFDETISLSFPLSLSLSLSLFLSLSLLLSLPISLIECNVTNGQRLSIEASSN